MSALGYIDGKNFHLRNKVGTPNPEKIREAILELLPDIDLLVAWGTIGGVAAKRVASTIPVVFVSVGAPVDIGLVESLAHPGGNMTGITCEAASETYAKRLQLLKEITPRLSRVAVLGAKDDPNFPFAMVSLRKGASRFEVSLTPIEISSSDDLGSAFDEVCRSQSEALVVVSGGLMYANNKAIADLALANKLPSCHAFKEAVTAGGLISLGPDLFELAYQAAHLVDKIIRGARPADLPVEQPSRYSLTINLKTATALGLTINSTLLASADEVIE